MSEQEMTIGFIGNPNCGKTTLFNAYTGANLKVANWPGVTVEKVEGVMKDHDLTIHLVDLPGTYSLTSYTMEETVSRQFILSDEVDVIINVADASALERSLYLTLQLLELGKPVVLALNMMDIVEKRGMEIDLHRLPEMLGIPVIPVSARQRRGLDILLHAAAHHKDCTDPDCLIHHHKVRSKHQHDHHSEYAMVYSDEIEDKIDQIMPELKRRYPGLTNYRWHALKLLEEDKEITEKYPVNLPQVLDRSYESDIINQKYDFIGEIIGEVLLHKERQDLLTERADKLLTSKVWSIPIFLGIMAVTFFLTFTIGDWIKGYFELGIDWLSGVAQRGLTAVHAGTILTSLMVDGIIGGVGTIVTFLPNILILFFVSGTTGGQRLYGPCGLCDGGHHEQAGAFRQSLHSHATGIWLYGSRHHGFPCAGKQAGPLQGHAGNAIYELQRPADHLHLVLRDVFRRQRHADGLLHVPDWHCGCHCGVLRHPPAGSEKERQLPDDRTAGV